MEPVVVGLDEVGRGQVATVGGKGAGLGEISSIRGVQVPDGVCVTTAAFLRVLGGAPSIAGLITRLSVLRPEDGGELQRLGAEIRLRIEEAAVPDDLEEAISRSVTGLGDGVPLAVRSSATTEDMATASFAGQHDSFLNVVGAEAVLRCIRRCWSSLYSERAVAYRMRNGIDQRAPLMAVVVQQMVAPQAAGVLFTADPVTSNRRVSSVEAVLGLGEALVSGLVRADTYQVRDGAVVARSIATKERVVEAAPGGGTRERGVDADRRDRPALTETQILELDRLGRAIEAHTGRPQDIEWCLGDEGFRIVQSRPITTLFPIPDTDDDDSHVYVSVGHQQMMTDAMKPLGLSLWKLTAARPMSVAGGRLFVDVARELASPATAAAIIGALGRSDPLIGDALQSLVDRGGAVTAAGTEPATTLPGWAVPTPVETDPTIVTGLIERNRASIAALRHELRTKAGPALVDAVRSDVQELKRLLFDPESLPVIMAGMDAAQWLNEHLKEWLGEKGVADTLTRSVPHNVTSEMGLALLDVADAIRPHPQVVEFLHQVEVDTFLDGLDAVEGGPDARQAIDSFLDAYGMRCAGEIDITRPRWREEPSSLVPLLLADVRSFEAGEAKRRFERGLHEAMDKEVEVLAKVRALPDGAAKVAETKRMIDRVRTFSGYREYPKYGMVTRYFVYKQALLAEAERQVRSGVLGEAHDVFYLTLEEFDGAVRTGVVDHELIARRKGDFVSYRSLTAPRVFTSDGEVMTGTYRREDVPAGALVGLPVSSGTVEGRARVVVAMADADLRPGDILVTPYTDPSWTPAFVLVTGLVTEVGGLMTHGAVIAREYGLPAVVGVERATQLIRDGQRIRVHGSEGFVELLD